MGKWYKVTGLTKEMIDGAGGLNEMFLVWEKDGNVNVRARLTLIEALVMKFKLRRFNLKNPVVFDLKRVKRNEDLKD